MRFREPIERGEVTLTFRRWKRSQVLAGRTYRTGVGRLVVEAVEVVNPNKISAVDVRAAGFRSLVEARDADPRAELAASFGRETEPFKLDVRKLKNLGLTISLKVGYELSPRGEEYLRASGLATGTARQ